MKVKELMTEDVLTCPPDALLADAARIMWERDCGIVPVVDSHGRIAGVVTDRDACLAAYTQRKPLTEIRVSAAMATGVHTCHPDDDVAHAEDLMSEKRIRRLLVVDDSDRLVGLLSIDDLARRALEEVGGGFQERVARTLGHVCRRRHLVPW